MPPLEYMTAGIALAVFLIVEYVPGFDRIRPEHKPQAIAAIGFLFSLLPLAFGGGWEDVQSLFIAVLGAMGVSAVAKNAFPAMKKGES